MTTLADAPRRQRSDGARTRGAIVSAAAELATVEGLDRLSIGSLAEYLGMSKSGLFAHFRSKEALQLATIEGAWATFDAEVVERALVAPPGRATVIALIDEFLDHLERRVFPGGCFFAATLAEMHMRPGPVTERLGAFELYWLGLLREHATIARDTGEIAAAEDVEQLVYELESHVVHAHFAYPASGDARVLDRSRQAVRRRLGAPITT
jgi:AcrR family transcriptional regulator